MERGTVHQPTALVTRSVARANLREARMHQTLRIAAILLSLLLTLSHSAFAWSPRSEAIKGPTNSQEHEELLDEIRGVGQRAVSFPGTPGLSIAVAVGDEIILAEGFGLADVEHDIAVHAETVFRIGSVTKQFTAAAILTLIEEDEIGLQDDLTEHYDFDTQGKPVTINQLLNHTSGIPSYTDLGQEWIKTVRRDLSHDQLLELVEGKPFDFEPGEDWRYNNTGYYLLGAIIEDTTGERYDDFLTDRFFDPLGMDRTRIGSHIDIVKDRARGYAAQSGALKNADFISMNQPGAAGALLSTASDLIRWTRGLVNGDVLSEDAHRRMITPDVFPGEGEMGYACGLMVQDFEGTQRIGHGGGIHGFVSQLSYYPEYDLTIAVLANSTAQPVGPMDSTIARKAFSVLKVVKVAEAAGAFESGE